MGAARRVVHEALAASNADVKLVYTLDSSVGANFLGSPEVAQAVERSQAQLALVVAGAPATHIGTVASTALGRTLKLNAQNKKNLVALQTAVAAFPQAGGRLR